MHETKTYFSDKQDLFPCTLLLARPSARNPLLSRFAFVNTRQSYSRVETESEPRRPTYCYSVAPALTASR
jgi:hypothetical protein